MSTPNYSTPFGAYDANNEVVAKFYERLLLEMAVPNTQFARFALTRTLPKRHSSTMILTRPDLPTVTQATALTPGITPPPINLSQTRYEVKVEEYGNYVQLDDYYEYTTRDPVLRMRAEQLIEHAKLYIDAIFRDLLMSTASTLNCTRGNNQLPITELNRDDLVSAIIAIRKAFGKPIAHHIEASEDFATSPVPDSYMAIAPVDLIGDLLSLPNFVRSAHYGHRALYAGELGAMDEIRFVTTELNPAREMNLGGQSVPVYSTIVTARNAYGRVGLGSEGVQLIHQPLGSGGSSDPLAQRSTYGYKLFLGAAVLFESWVINLQSTLGA